MPEDTKFVDGGVGAPQYIFSLPDPSWEKVIVIDALEFNGEPGELRIYSPNNMVINEYGGAHAVPLQYQRQLRWFLNNWITKSEYFQLKKMFIKKCEKTFKKRVKTFKN